MKQTRDVLDHLIVGAGVAGLAYAWRRTREGRRVLLLESRHRVGGAHATRRQAGFAWDEDDEAVLGEAPHLEALLGALDGAPRLAGTHGAIPLPRPTPSRPGAHRGAVALGALARAAYGGRFTATVVRPAVHAFHGTAPDRLGAYETAPALALDRRRPRLDRFRVRVLETGVAALAEALAAALGASVRTSTEVLGVSEEGDVPVVWTANEEVAAREVVLAVPAPVQARLLQRTAPHHAEALGATPTGSVVSAAVGVPADAMLAAPPGPGFLVPARRHRVRAVLLTSRLAPARAPEGRALVQVRLGGPDHPDLASLPDDLLRAVIETEVSEILGAQAEVVACARLRTPAPPPGLRARLAGITGTLRARGIRLLGSHVLGLGLDRAAAAGAPVPRGVPAGVELA